jgi:hypothetical protein
MSQLDQNLLYATSFAVLLATLILFVWQYIRMNRKDKDD